MLMAENPSTGPMPLADDTEVLIWPNPRRTYLVCTIGWLKGLRVTADGFWTGRLARGGQRRFLNITAIWP